MQQSNTDSRQTTSPIPLAGGTLLLARFTWVMIALLSISSLVMYIAVAYEKLRQIGDWRRAALFMLGIRDTFYAGYYVTLMILFAAVYMGVALFIFWRKSDDRMALLISAMLMSFGLAGGSVVHLAVLVQVIAEPNLLSVLLAVAAVIGSLLFYPSFFVFPDGQFVPRWTRWVVLLIILYLVPALLPESHPLHIPFIITTMPFVFFGVAVYAQIYRFKRVSTPSQRQQTKWLVYGLLFSCTLILIVSYLLPAVVPVLRPPNVPAVALGYEMFSHLVFMSLIVVPLAIGFGILRYRLWDIDFIINRSLVYGGVTVLLGLVIGVVLFVASQVLQGQQGIALLLGAAAAGALFQPARRWLQRFVDQRLYNIQIEYRKPRSPADESRETLVHQSAPFGVYKNLQLIGRGGMGEVYKAQHTTLNRLVAIKLLSTNLADDQDVLKRFQREAETLARLQHPNIVRVFDYGEEQGTRYMAMEYIDGQDLSAYLKTHKRLTLAEALPLLRDIASALDYAHTQGLVHRDIKPSNVMLESQNGSSRAVLTDFGIARILGAHTRITRSGIIGTLDYIAPEQIQEAKDIDGRVDVYALGIMVYQMLTGEVPFKQQNAGALLIAHLTQPAPDPRDLLPELPREAAHAIRKALAKQPGERYATAGEFVAALG
ncbi:MAG: protein kinase [Anaerolineae bacterium]